MATLCDVKMGATLRITAVDHLLEHGLLDVGEIQPQVHLSALDFLSEGLQGTTCGRLTRYSWPLNGADLGAEHDTLRARRELVVQDR